MQEAPLPFWGSHPTEGQAPRKEALHLVFQDCAQEPRPTQQRGSSG